MGGGSNQPTQTTHTDVQMTPEQRQIFNLALPGVQDFAASVPDRYPGSTVAPFDPAQVAGQNIALGAAPAQGALASDAAGANDNLLTNIWDPNFNPALKGAVDAAVRPVTEAYQHTTLPGVRDEFNAAGAGFGGSRRGVADAVEQSKYLTNVGDTSAKVVNANYQANLDAQLKALGLVPSTQGALTTPAVTTSGVGDVRQNLAQALLSEQVGNFNYDQLAPFLQSQDLIALLSGLPGSTSDSVSTGNNPTSSGTTARNALGGAAAGASLGTAIMPGIGTGVGAGLGGLLAFLH